MKKSIEIFFLTILLACANVAFSEQSDIENMEKAYNIKDVTIPSKEEPKIETKIVLDRPYAFIINQKQLKDKYPSGNLDLISDIRDRKIPPLLLEIWKHPRGGYSISPMLEGLSRSTGHGHIDYSYKSVGPFADICNDKKILKIWGEVNVQCSENKITKLSVKLPNSATWRYDILPPLKKNMRSFLPQNLHPDIKEGDKVYFKFKGVRNLLETNNPTQHFIDYCLDESELSIKQLVNECNIYLEFTLYIYPPTKEGGIFKINLKPYITKEKMESKCKKVTYCNLLPRYGSTTHNLAAHSQVEIFQSAKLFTIVGNELLVYNQFGDIIVFEYPPVKEPVMK